MYLVDANRMAILLETASQLPFMLVTTFCDVLFWVGILNLAVSYLLILFSPEKSFEQA